MTNTIYTIIIFILAFNLLISVLLEYLNLKSSKQAIPQILSDIYDNDNYNKQQLYKFETTRLSIIETMTGSLLLIAFFGFGGFGWLHVTISVVVRNVIIQTLTFFGTIGLLSLII